VRNLEGKESQKGLINFDFGSTNDHPIPTCHVCLGDVFEEQTYYGKYDCMNK